MCGCMGLAGLSPTRRNTDIPTHPLPVPPRTPSPLFDPAMADALLESADRHRWQKPADIVRALGIRPGMAVADIGAGSGYLLPQLSNAVRPTGRVYAEEIQAPFLAKLRSRAARHKNVTVVRGTPTDPKLPLRRIDRFVLLTVYHEVQNPVAFLKTIQRYAAPKARLAVIDFDAGRGGDPPAPPGHELPESAVISEARAAGWTLVEKHEFLSSQFVLIFKQTDET